VSRLAFLSPDEADVDVPRVSPIRDAASTALTDVSALGKLEVRGDVAQLECADGEELVPITPRRALLVVDGPTRAARDRVTALGYRVYDVTAALAAFELEGAALLRRLTELDLGTLPATGSIARGTPALIERRSADGENGDRFRLFVPQELARFVADVVTDMHAGIRA
jgi:glycine cleavage system aminomethyltransferase T